MPIIVIKDAQTGEVIERDMTPEEEAEYVTPEPTIEELEADVQEIADDLVQSDERMMALALATVDLRIADIPAGATRAQVRQQFRDRVVFYLRQRRGL